VLLEVLVALVILATAAMSVLGLVAQSAEQARRAEEAEHSLAEAERLLIAMTLLVRRDLDLRLGRRTAGSLVVEVQRPHPVLYRVSVARSDAPDSPDLVTLVYRPETPP
jgi:type II secretory pathway pseudopilin PulG